MHEDNVVFQTKQHWVLFLQPVILMVVAIALMVLFPSMLYVSLMLGGVSILLGILFYISYCFSLFEIKQSMITVTSGVLVRQSINIPIAKIETIDVRQTIFGSLLNYGTLIITGTGGTHNVINNIAHPLTCRRHIEQLLNE